LHLGAELAPPTPADPFASVPTPLQAALARRGFTKLTAVQDAVLGALGEGRDLRISSQTGSGKTVALGFALAPPLIAAADAPHARRVGPRVLLIVPTRELAEQVRSELDWLFADVRDVSTECVTGGTSVSAEQRRLKKKPCILVGTPGRLLDHLTSGALDCSGVEQLVLDEADQMLDLGFRDDLEAILATMPASRRTHLVSATFPPEVRSLVAEFQDDPLHVEGTRLGSAHADIEHVACLVHTRDRYAALVNLLLLAGDDRTLVFVRRREDTNVVAERLAADGFAALPLSGELAQAQRTRTLDAFRTGAITTLVATDVAARGLDINDVASVVHVDLPVDDAVYTHRSGRTGRAGKAGRSVLFVPLTAERRARRMLDAARVRAVWRPVPRAADVHAVLEGRARARIDAALAAPQPLEQVDREEAARLLAAHEPHELVARLLRLARREPPAAPVDVAAQSARGGGPRALGGAPAGRHGPRPRAAAYARFAINWGAREGANPKRLLAHVCRRGDVSSRYVGAIEIGMSSATFEIEAEVASRFASNAVRPDRREPHLVIRPADRDERRGPARAAQ
jgi:ATP-dependent RNA helicase DeaD